MRQGIQTTGYVSTFLGAAEEPVRAQLRGGNLVFARVGLGRNPGRLHIRAEACNGYSLIFQLMDHPPHEHWVDGRACPASASPKGCLHIADLGRPREALIQAPFDSLNLVFDRAFLDGLADEADVPRVADLRVPQDWATPDPVFDRLAPVVTGMLCDPAPPGRLFADHLAIATMSHVAAQYGSMRRLILRPGGLALWQERRAREMIAANLAKEVSLADVAEQCGLSASHFSKAFKVSVGLTPHGWLQSSRIARARELLVKREHPLAEIATLCGFADQSHFNRIFRRALGVSPGAWRRDRLS